MTIEISHFRSTTFDTTGDDTAPYSELGRRLAFGRRQGLRAPHRAIAPDIMQRRLAARLPGVVALRARAWSVIASATSAIVLTGVLLACHIGTAPAFATVYEYGPENSLTIDGEPEPKVRDHRLRGGRSDRGPVALNSADGKYVALAREIASRHAGGRGPRSARLDVSTFIRMFTELVQAESAFDPRALSPEGAQGLGQLMPATARSLGVTNPWDPAQNLDGAARYLCAQLERFGDARLALAAYNAGPHRVAQYGGVPPYSETRAYVAKISAAVGLEPPADHAPTGRPATQSSSDSSQGNTSVWNY